MTIGVYRIAPANCPPQECYVGQSVDIERRWNDHIGHLSRGEHKNRRFQEAWLKHGGGAFGYEILQIITSRTNLQNALLLAEQKWMNRLSPIYNIMPPLGNYVGVPTKPYKRNHKAKNFAKRFGYIGITDQTSLDRMIKRAVDNKVIGSTAAQPRDEATAKTLEELMVPRPTKKGCSQVGANVIVTKGGLEGLTGTIQAVKAGQCEVFLTFRKIVVKLPPGALREAA